MKLFKTLTVLGAISVINVSAFGATTIISDTFTAVNVTNGFLLGAGINSEINPPTSTRLTGTVAANLRYIRRGNKNESAYSVSSGTSCVITSGSQSGRFTLSDGTTNEVDGTTNVFDFGPALGVSSATPQNPRIYEVGITMANKVNVNNTNNTVGRLNFAFGTVEAGAGSWSFGVQILPTTNGTYNIYKRIKPLASGLASDLNAVITNTGANGTELSFLMRITDAGAEPDTNSVAHSRLQLSMDAGATWFYDTQTDPILVNGWRFETATRYVSFDQAPNSGQDIYDNFFISVPEANGGVLSISNNGGSANINFQGIASQEYIFQRSQDLANWSDISTNTANESGVIQFSEVPPVNPAFYRTRSP